MGPVALGLLIGAGVALVGVLTGAAIVGMCLTSSDKPKEDKPQ